MKLLALIIAFAALGQLRAQTWTVIKQAEITEESGETSLNFTVSKEANVWKYVIEVATDSSYEVIGAILSLGNTLQPRTYSFDCFTAYPMGFRVKQIGYGGNVMESIVVPGRLSTSSDQIVNK